MHEKSDRKIGHDYLYESMPEVSLNIFLSFICLFFLPESLETVSFCLVRQDAAEGKEESIIFRYCFLARFRMSFSSLTTTEFEPDDSSFCPGQTKSYSLCHIFLLSHHYSYKSLRKPPKHI